MRRVSRLKMKLIQAPPGSPRGAFSFVAGRCDIPNWTRIQTGSAPATYPNPIHPDTERERQGQVALYLLRMHIRYP